MTAFAINKTQIPFRRILLIAAIAIIVLPIANLFVGVSFVDSQLQRQWDILCAASPFLSAILLFFSVEHYRVLCSTLIALLGTITLSVELLILAVRDQVDKTEYHYTTVVHLRSRNIVAIHHMTRHSRLHVHVFEERSLVPGMVLRHSLAILGDATGYSGIHQSSSDGWEMHFDEGYGKPQRIERY